MHTCSHTHPPTHTDQLLITLPPLIRHTGQVRVPLLTILAHHLRVVELVLPEVPLRVVVGINVDLGQCVVSGWFLHSLVDTGLQQREQQLQPGRWWWYK